MSLIVLHIGAFKTGTSFLQHTLAANREALRDDGVLYPGEGKGSHFAAVREFARAPRASDDSTFSWSELVEQCVRWDGQAAILSAENLSLLRADTLAAVTSGFGDNPVRVVYGARDLVRTVPSQWQTTIRNSDGNAPSYTDYIADLRSGPGASGAATMFWRTHDWPDVIRAWGGRFGPDSMALLTVPPSGSGESTLWHRFGEAVGFDATQYPLATMRNSSLGASSAEVVRRISTAMASGDSHVADPIARNRAIRQLARRVLSQRSADEQRVLFPVDAEPWARERTEEMLVEVAALGAQVYGSLDELRPVVPTALPRAGTTSPQLLPVDDLLDAAQFGLERWAGRARVEAIRRVAGDPQTMLDLTVDALVQVLDVRATRGRPRAGRAASIDVDAR